MNKNIDELSLEFIEKHIDTCSIKTISCTQKNFYIIMSFLGLALLIYRWDLFVFIVAAVFTILYSLSTVFKLISAIIGCCYKYEKFPMLDDDSLPVYTILLPMYREENIAKQLTDNILALDYPIEKLDVKLLLEEDDCLTLEAINSMNLSPSFQTIIMNTNFPKTKPRACNYGLKYAKGKYCVIFDAEDKPEVDQLRKAASMFQHLGDNVVCLQAKLNYHNSRQNILTKLFTIEYTSHFDLMLPGMQFFNFPLPLGGTSNHFKTQPLRDIGGWDPFNVTEDCDLGIRIYENNYKTMLLDSTTWEDATSNIFSWIRQRSRWAKGFIQTHLVHYRNYFKTIARLGVWGTFGGFLAVGGGSLMLLVNLLFVFIVPLYLCLIALGCYQGVSVFEQIVYPNNYLPSDYGIRIGEAYLKAWPIIYYGESENAFFSALSIVFASFSALLFIANFFFVIIGVVACIKRKFWHLIAYTPLLFFYWFFMSIAAWKGFIQLFYNPFYWEKTPHLLSFYGKRK